MEYIKITCILYMYDILWRVIKMMNPSTLRHFMHTLKCEFIKLDSFIRRCLVFRWSINFILGHLFFLLFLLILLVFVIEKFCVVTESLCNCFEQINHTYLHTRKKKLLLLLCNIIIETINLNRNATIQIWRTITFQTK